MLTIIQVSQVSIRQSRSNFAYASKWLIMLEGIASTCRHTLYLWGINVYVLVIIEWEDAGLTPESFSVSDFCFVFNFIQQKKKKHNRKQQSCHFSKCPFVWFKWQFSRLMGVYDSRYHVFEIIRITWSLLFPFAMSRSMFGAGHLYFIPWKLPRCSSAFFFCWIFLWFKNYNSSTNLTRLKKKP